MDSLSPQQRHNNMAAIHGKDTKPEMVVRKWLRKKCRNDKLNLQGLNFEPLRQAHNETDGAGLGENMWAQFCADIATHCPA